MRPELKVHNLVSATVMFLKLSITDHRELWKNGAMRKWL